MLEVLRVVNALSWRLSLSSYTLFEWSVVFSHFSYSSFSLFLDRCSFVS